MTSEKKKLFWHDTCLFNNLVVALSHTFYRKGVFHIPLKTMIRHLSKKIDKYAAVLCIRFIIISSSGQVRLSIQLNSEWVTKCAKYRKMNKELNHDSSIWIRVKNVFIVQLLSFFRLTHMQSNEPHHCFVLIRRSLGVPISSNTGLSIFMTEGNCVANHDPSYHSFTQSACYTRARNPVARMSHQ